MPDRIHEWVLRERETILGSLRHIVGIDTQNLAPHGNERAGQMAVAGMLGALGCVRGGGPGLRPPPR